MHRIVSVLSRCALVLTVFSAITLLPSCKKAGSETNAPPGGSAPPAAPVSVAAAIEREVKEWDEFTGRLEATEQVVVRPRVTGYVQSIHFQDGKEVKKGDLLFVIDPRPYEAELKRAEADLAGAKNREELARLRLKRASEMVRDKFVAKENYDERLSEQRTAQSQIKAAEAAVETARLNLDFTRIRAPISGRIGRAEVTVGNLVQVGGADANGLTSIVGLDPIYAYFEGDEQIYLKYGELARSGERPSSREARNPVRMGLANEQGFPHEGYIDFVDNRLNAASGTIRVRAVFDNKERKFTPGLFARLRLVGSGTYKAVLVNDRAVGTDQSQRFVLVVGADKKANRRQVKLGPLVDGLRVIKDGVKSGELIVVNGMQRVMFPGMPVDPKTVPMEGEPVAAPTPPAAKQG